MTWLVGKVVFRLVLGLQIRALLLTFVGFFVGFEGRNRQWVVVVVGVPDLTLVVLSGGVELRSGAAVRRLSVGSGCDVALRLTSTLPLMRPAFV